MVRGCEPFTNRRIVQIPEPFRTSDSVSASRSEVFPKDVVELRQGCRHALLEADREKLTHGLVGGERHPGPAAGTGFDPSGPVTKYDTVPPGRSSWSTTVAGWWVGR